MDRVTLIQTPSLPGLRFRYFQGEADFEGLAAVHEGARAWDQIDPRSARESVPTAAALARTFPPETLTQNPGLLIAELNGSIIGYCHILWRWTEESGARVYLHLGYVLPAWRHKGIGTAMLWWAQERIRAIAAEERDGGPAFLATNVSTTESEARVLIDRAGYQVVRRLSDMVLEPIPELICRIRPNMNVGLFPEVATRKRWQRLGIQKALMVCGLSALRARGVEHARLFTDADDGQGARSLYERLGFREVKQHLLYRKPLHVHPHS